MASFDPFAALVDSLPKSARAAYPFIRSMSVAKPEYPLNQIQEILTDSNFPIKRQTLSDIVAVIRNKADVTQFIRTYGNNAIIPDSVHKVSVLRFAGGNKVQYLVGTNSANKLIPEAIYVNAPAGLSAEQIYGKAAAAFRYEEGSGLASGDLSDVVFSVDDARFSPGQQSTGEFVDDTVYSGA